VGKIVPGSLVTVHGENFPPGKQLKLKLDGQVISTSSNLQPVQPSAPVAMQVATMAFVLLPRHTTQTTARGLTVRGDGTFDVRIVIPNSWQASIEHIVQAQAVEPGAGAQAAVITSADYPIAPSPATSGSNSPINTGGSQVGNTHPTPTPTATPIPPSNYTLTTTIGGEPFTLHIIQGKVCMDRDNGQSYDLNSYAYLGRQVGATVTDAFQCNGTYQNGQLNYTETVTSESIASALDPAVAQCTQSGQYTYLHLEGTVSGNTLSGTYLWEFAPQNCSGNAAATFETAIDRQMQPDNVSMENGGKGNGNWSGQLSVA
jgi:hypothetical protein